MLKIKNNPHLKSDFLKNVFTLLSGATVAQIITLISIPILTRIYTPEDFGHIAIYLSIANIVAAFSTGRYELAIMLPKKRTEALAIFKGSFRIAFIISLISLIAIILLKSFDHKFSSFIEPFYFYFLPLSIFIVGLGNLFFQWYTREKQFKIQANLKIIKSGSSSGVNVFLGLLYNLKSLGLFFGHIAGQGIQQIIFGLRFYKEEKNNLKIVDANLVKEQLKLNNNFPRFSAPMAFLNAISKDVLIYVFKMFFSTSLVGQYSNATKVISYPLELINQSFMTVFYQKINETNKKLRFYLISYFGNFIIATIVMIPIVFWGEELFVFVLGNDWEIAGSIAKYMAPLTVASFAMRSVSNIFSLTRKNGILLIWQICYLVLILITIFISKSTNFDVMLLYFSLVGAFLYIALAFMGYRIMKKTYEKPS
ncbi:MAG: hypothetical protein C0597_05650 [Marinilabiliales bacterium]|nr:MAG: hypothetical protein C0597_05650 [Marinilabiliales bacterium]